MRPTIAALVAVEGLELLPLVVGEAWHREVEWAHGTDLADPRPFIGPGQLVLTTGGQFEHAAAADFETYVERLAGVGIVGIGFGTEIYRDGTPVELVAACRRTGLSLFEVPYRTPFIAVSRWIADGNAREARARDDWARDAQRRVSTAAVGDGGLARALTVAAELLRRQVVLFAVDGSVRARHPRRRQPVEDEAQAEAVRLLRLLRRAGRRLPSDSGVLQTLGRVGRLRGALAVLGPALDGAEQSVLMTLAALVEVSLEAEAARRDEARVVFAQLLGLLVEGRHDVVQRALLQMGMRLPEPQMVALCLDRAAISAAFRSVLEARLPSRDGLFVADHGTDRLIVLAPPARVAEVVDQALADGARVGVSSPAAPADAARAVAESLRAHDAAAAATALRFADFSEGALLGLLSRTEVARIAAGRLAGLEPGEARELLDCAAVWLRANCQWEPAARELGIHRHSLQARIARLGAALRLPLDTFAGRAELWALLTAAEGPSAAGAINN